MREHLCTVSRLQITPMDSKLNAGKDPKSPLFSLRSVLVVIYLPSVLVVCVGVFSFLVEMVG